MDSRFDRLHVKLFAAIAGTIALLTLAAYLVFSWSFERGFIDYVSRADQARVQALAATLAESYGREGGWQSVVTDRERWIELVRSGLGIPPASSVDAAGGPPATAGRMLLTVDPRLLLFDAERRQLVGRTELAARARLEPIVWRGSTVGYLGYVPRTLLLESIESLYLERQQLTFGVLAAAMLAASVLLGAGVSYWLTRRIRRLAASAQALIAGDYSQRLEARGNDELAQLARDFNVLAQTLQAARRSRQQWIADISHELRTPLAILRGEIEALQDGVRPLDQAAIGSLAAESARLARLVEDLHTLSLSDLGALTYHKEPVDLAEAIADAVEPQRRALAARGLALRTDLADDAIVMGDADRLGQLFGNLLQNSTRYTDAPGTIAVRLGRAGERVVVDWEDSAPGVPDEELARLTDRLYRVEGSRSRAGGGSGLGLAIVRALVEGHGGTMSAHRSELGGLRIRIELPGEAS